MTTDDGYADWLRSNPAPDLQELVARHGGYDKIPPEAWAEHDRAMAEWHARWRVRSQGSSSGEIPHSDHSDPEALCICGSAGVYWRRRKGGGRVALVAQHLRERHLLG